MRMKASSPWLALAALGIAALACGCEPIKPAAAQVKAPTREAVADARPEDRHVYRFDFTLTASEPTGAAPATTSFSVSLVEHERGEMIVGSNVPLVAAPVQPALVASPGVAAPRQDVGIKVSAQYALLGDDVLLDVNSEMSAFEAPAVRKAVARGAVLATPGKPAVVSVIGDDRRKYQLTVVATKVR